MRMSITYKEGEMPSLNYNNLTINTMSKLNANAFGMSAAILSAIGMLILGALASAGYANATYEIMKAHHISFDVGFVGTILGALEAFIFSYAIGFLFAAIYNKLILNQ